MRKQILLGALTLFGLTFTMQATAQEDQLHCGLTAKLKKLYADNPQMEEDYRKMIEQFHTTEVVNGVTREIYIIPLVFHVMHEYGDQNIVDAQIHDAVRILNEDFRMLNADVSNVVPAFDTVRGDARIEFRLATIDPYGNCTNGIEHIYTHLTNDSDDNSKMNQWHRSKYLNIWVMNSIGDEGVAGYAYYPTATQGEAFQNDGIIIIHEYIGGQGLPGSGWTGTNGRSRALTHEIGHYLGLAHVWGSTNDPGVACGDDGVTDTPITKGHDNCSKPQDASCNPPIIENVQNFMEYSYCSNMYTKKQGEFMRNVLSLDVGGRSNLYTATNHAQTGIDVYPAPLCAPQADFSANKRTICQGDSVFYKDASWRSGDISYAWSFPGGSPSTSTSKDVWVKYPTSGHYTATLTASNATGSTTKTFDNIVYVSPNWVENVGPAVENFDGTSVYWLSQNPESNFAFFNRVSGVGKGSTSCYKLNNYRDISEAQPYSDESKYYTRLKGSKDYLISESYDLSTSTNVHISFDYAYGTRATNIEDITETLQLTATHDCGKTWDETIKMGGNKKVLLSDTTLISAGYVGNTDFYPVDDSKWKHYEFTYDLNPADDKKVRFRFEFIASNLSSNLYIDNFNITGTMGIAENDEFTGVSISPNPVQSGSEIAVQISDASAEIELQIIDVNGIVISTKKVEAASGTQTVMIPMNVAKGCYFLNAVKGNSKSLNRVIVF